MSDEDAEIIRLLTGQHGIFEAHRKSTFRCLRTRADGTAHELTVEVLDAGPGCRDPQRRYACVARSEDGRFARGSQGPSLAQVIAGVHWWDLDG